MPHAARGQWCLGRRRGVWEPSMAVHVSGCMCRCGYNAAIAAVDLPRPAVLQSMLLLAPAAHTTWWGSHRRHPPACTAAAGGLSSLAQRPQRAVHPAVAPPVHWTTPGIEHRCCRAADAWGAVVGLRICLAATACAAAPRPSPRPSGPRRPAFPWAPRRLASGLQLPPPPSAIHSWLKPRGGPERPGCQRPAVQAVRWLRR
jgi:hypothetical protein